jgi:hypothetical protein
MENLLLFDGMNEAIIGTTERNGEILVCYSIKKMKDILINNDGMTEEEAIEFLEYNTVGTNVGPQTPICIDDMNPLEIMDNATS